MNDLQILRRKELVPAAVPADVAKEIAKELGYTPLKHQVVTVGKVAECFKAVGIVAFDERTVDVYKAKALKVRNAAIEFPYIVGIAALVALAAVVEIVLVVSNGGGMLWGVLVTIPALAAFSVIAAAEMVSSKLWKWQSRALDSYTREVPIYALELALQLGRELNKVKIKHTWQIDELVEPTYVHQPDPFLVLIVNDKIGVTRYTLEVWDEPGFGGERSV